MIFGGKGERGTDVITSHRRQQEKRYALDKAITEDAVLAGFVKPALADLSRNGH